MADRVVMLTGATGLVGTWLRRTVPDGMELVSLTHRAVVAEGRSVFADLRDATDTTEAIKSVMPSVVVHAAMAVDAGSIVGATANVAEAAGAVGAGLVYVSTDAVFAGDGRPVGEDSVPDPIWDYGRWKADAEQIILSGAADWAVVRLPLVVSLDPADRAVERIRRAAEQNETSDWFGDETRQPAMAADIAHALWQITQLAAGERAGVWHLPGLEILTRFEMAQRVVTALNLNRGAIASVPTPPDAIRPQHLHLLDQRARNQVGWDPSRVPQ